MEGGNSLRWLIVIFQKMRTSWDWEKDKPLIIVAANTIFFFFQYYLLLWFNNVIYNNRNIQIHFHLLSGHIAIKMYMQSAD